MYDGCPSPWFASYTTTYVLYVYSGWRWYTASCNGCARICRRLLDCSIDDVVRLMIRCVRILYSSTADWHRCTCCLLSWIVVVIRLMYVSMCRMDGYIVRWFEFLLLRWRWMMHMTCAFFDVAIFVDGARSFYLVRKRCPWRYRLIVITVR